MFICGKEDAVAVGIDRNHSPVLAEVTLQQPEVSIGCLSRVESRDDLAGGVVDQHQKRHSRPAALQPVVNAPVSLNQFAEAFPASTSSSVLVTPAFGLPQRHRYQPLTQRLGRDRQAPSSELIRRQRRPKAAIVLDINTQYLTA